MKKFALITKMGEKITSVTCSSLTEAVQLLSIKKRLNPEALLEIYEVKEI